MENERIPFSSTHHRHCHPISGKRDSCETGHDGDIVENRERERERERERDTLNITNPLQKPALHGFHLGSLSIHCIDYEYFALLSRMDSLFIRGIWAIIHLAIREHESNKIKITTQRISPG